MALSIDDLEVFRRAYAASLEVHRVSLRFPKIEQYELGSQLRRASRSICANLVEGFGRQGSSRAEFRRFVVTALGSADEVQLWCRYCEDLGYVDALTAARWREAYGGIARMLQGLARSLSASPSDT